MSQRNLMIKLLRFISSITFSMFAGAFASSVMANDRAGAGDRSAYRYELVMSKDDKLCQYMLGALNHHVAEGKMRHQEIEDPAFSAIHWTRYGISSDNKFNYDAEYAKFDVNNDGQDELVVRWRRGSIKLIDVDALYILPDKVTPESLHRFQDLEARSVGGVEIQESYDLGLLPPLPRQDWMKKDKQYFPGLERFILMHPFLFQSKYYLLLAESPDVRIDPELLVVARYLTGRVSSADPSKMSDVCYISRPERNPTIKR